MQWRITLPKIDGILHRDADTTKTVSRASVESDAVVTPNEIASAIERFSLSPTASPALNASPAPTVSSTLTRKAGTTRVPSAETHNTPFSPRVSSTCSTPS